MDELSGQEVIVGGGPVGLTFLGRESGRIPIPSRRDRAAGTTGADVGWPTPEPPHRINQLYLEPVLFAGANASLAPGIACRKAWSRGCPSELVRKLIRH